MWGGDDAGNSGGMQGCLLFSAFLDGTLLAEIDSGGFLALSEGGIEPPLFPLLCLTHSNGQRVTVYYTSLS